MLIQCYSKVISNCFSRFFKLVGTVFGFVAKDIESKLVILNEHRTSSSASQYHTILGMLSYEQEQGLVHAKTTPPSGARTLLRLHRALEFILEFMNQLATTNDSAKTAEIAGDVYERTLAQYHPWIVRKMAYMAMYTLPNKQQLIEKMCKQPKEEVIDLMHETVKQGQPIFTATQRFYIERGLLDLP